MFYLICKLISMQNRWRIIWIGDINHVTKIVVEMARTTENRDCFLNWHKQGKTLLHATGNKIFSFPCLLGFVLLIEQLWFGFCVSCLSFFYWPLFCLSFFYWPLFCLSFFDLQILITSLWYLQTRSYIMWNPSIEYQ